VTSWLASTHQQTKKTASAWHHRDKYDIGVIINNNEWREQKKYRINNRE